MLVKTDSQGILEKLVGEVKVGDLVVVEAGQRIAVDGVVEEGSATIDQSSLTGEFQSVEKTVGDLHILTGKRLVFWTHVLKAILDDTAVSENIVEKYRRERDALRSPDEIERQKGLH